MWNIWGLFYNVPSSSLVMKVGTITLHAIGDLHGILRDNSMSLGQHAHISQSRVPVGGHVNKIS
jgi:hypothetical protein